MVGTIIVPFKRRFRFRMGQNRLLFEDESTEKKDADNDTGAGYPA